MVKTYPPRAIDTIAQNTLKNYNEELVTGDPTAIPIEELIELHFGLIVEYRNLSKDGHIHGMTVFEDSIIPIYDERTKRLEPIFAKAGTILIDKRLLVGNRVKRMRFTLAHELGHYLMHDEYYSNQVTLPNKSKLKSVEQQEKEADDLGASLLMPYGRVKVAYKRLANKYSKEELIKKLAEIFEVSKEAMEIRLKKIGLYYL